MATSIGGSVGREGENLEADVELVQKLLAVRGFDPGLADGICGPLTIGAIVSFQRGFLRQPDGLIEVGGTSWRRLSNGAGTPATPSPAADWSGDSARWPQEKKLASLNPPFRAKVETVLTRLRGRGFKPKIVFGWRSVAVQLELVRAGRSTVRFSFHNAQHPDGTPNAYAADIIDERWGWEPAAEDNGYWEALGEEARALGLVWGGDWRTFKDVAHIQGRQNSELAATKRESGL